MAQSAYWAVGSARGVVHADQPAKTVSFGLIRTNGPVCVFLILYLGQRFPRVPSAETDP